jgi:uncharacterized membrane protein YdjX (TVP38/TMEM64 family)
VLSPWRLDKYALSDWRRILRGALHSLLGSVGLVLAIVGMGLLMQRYLDVEALRHAIDGFGSLAPLLFIAVAALKNILFIPVLPLAFLLGIGSLAFGKVYGACYFWLGTTAGACVAFLAARYGAARCVARLRRGRLRALDAVASDHGFLAIVGLRLVLFSNLPLNFGSGLTSMALRDYALGTLVGLVPRTFVVAALFESVGAPDIWSTMFTYPNALFVPLLLLSEAGGIVLLVALVRKAAGRTA